MTKNFNYYNKKMGSIHKNRIHPCYIIASERFHFESVMFSIYTPTPRAHQSFPNGQA